MMDARGDGSDTHYLQVTGDDGMGGASLSCGDMRVPKLHAQFEMAATFFQVREDHDLNE